MQRKLSEIKSNMDCVYVLYFDHTLFDRKSVFQFLHYVLNEHVWFLGHCEHQSLTGPSTDGNGIELSYFNQQESAF